MSFNGTIEVSCSDSDFYERKILRLEDDISILHEELAKVRTKLRIAEDFEIKYHILLESSEAQIQQLKDSIETKAEQRVKEKQGDKLKENDYKLEKKLRELEESLKKQAQKQLDNLSEERDALKRKVSQLNARKQEVDLLTFKVKKLEKENHQLHEQLDELRVQYQGKIGDQLDNLRLHLNSNFRERLANQRKTYEAKISALEKKLMDQVIVKDEENYKPAVLRNNELEPLRQMLDQQAEHHSRDMQELDGFIQQKNIQIKELLQQKIQIEEKNRSDILHRENMIAHLESTLLQKEKEHQEQLITAINQEKSLKEQKIAELASQIQQLRNQNANQKKWWSDKLINHDKEIESLTHKFEEEIQRINEQKNELKLKIVQLTDRLKQYEGDKAAGETQQLLASLNNLQQKEANMSNYEDGITFLEGQLARCQRKLEEQGRALRTANKELSQVRADAAKESAQMFQTLVNSKEEHNKQIHSLERQVNQLNQQLRNKEKDLKRYQRQLVTQQHEHEIEMGKLKYAFEEVQRDYKRTVQSKKENGLNKAQFDKVVGESTSYQKIKWLELEKQKNQIEAIYREKEEQLRLQYEGDLQAKNKELVLFKRQSQIAEKQIKMLQKENSQLRQELDINKQNCSVQRYHNKLASINLELALAQNIYDKMLKTKCRGNQPDASTYRSAEPYQQGEEESLRRDEPIEPSSYRSSEP